MMKKGVAIACVVLACQSVPLYAENGTEAKVRATVNALLGEDAVRSVAPAPLAGLYEVVLKSGELVYTNEQVSHIVVGSIIDAKTRENLTEKRQEALARIDFSTLPLNDAIVIKSGDGSRIFASFEDPNCRFLQTVGERSAAGNQYHAVPLSLPDSRRRFDRKGATDPLFGQPGGDVAGVDGRWQSATGSSGKLRHQRY